MKKQKSSKNGFKIGDIVIEKKSGRSTKVSGVPGDKAYDMSGYISPNEGFTDASGIWQFQSEYDLATSVKVPSPSGSIATISYNPMVISSGTSEPRKAPVFKVGDLVRAKEAASHFYWDTSFGWEGKVEALAATGQFSAITTKAALGRSTNIGSRFSELDPIHFDLIKAKEKKPIVVDIKKLDPLVIAPEIKSEIIAVIKQAQHTDKLFNEWGLGETIEYGRGMSMLFHGGPGTGKTFGAHCIARALGKELLVINAANIQTSEPGGANRNIESAFRSATDTEKVLFLDECDSLITSRSDVGIIIGSEINTLLTEIEKFEGVCILATNRIETMDEALERRLALIIEFPRPNFEQRKAIWSELIPKKLPLDNDVAIDSLAEFNLTGGQIKNVILQAARLAVSGESKHVTLEHFTQAMTRLLASKGKMGKGSRYIQVLSGKKPPSDYDISRI